jgi:ParB-like nuclease domain
VAFPPYKTAPVAALIPYARNARTHSDAQVARIAASIREFGFTNPILVDGERGVIAGHGRLLAARMLGMAEVPTIELAHLTPAQRRAYVLADNRLALDAGWDEALLRIELGELQAEGFDLALTGFEADEIGKLLIDAGEGLTDPDAVPEVPANPVSRPGDVWLLGRHRLVCGDSTDPETVAAALGGVRPHLMVTDPPYGVDYDPAWRNRAGLSATRRTGRVENDHRADWRAAWALFPGEVAYVWHGALHATTVAESLAVCGFQIRAQLVWAKDRLVLGRGHYHGQHEPCWYAVREGRSGHWGGDRSQTTLWQIGAGG